MKKRNYKKRKFIIIPKFLLTIDIGKNKYNKIIVNKKNMFIFNLPLIKVIKYKDSVLFHKNFKNEA